MKLINLINQMRIWSNQEGAPSLTSEERQFFDSFLCFTTIRGFDSSIDMGDFVMSWFYKFLLRCPDEDLENVHKSLSHKAMQFVLSTILRGDNQISEEEEIEFSVDHLKSLRDSVLRQNGRNSGYNRLKNYIRTNKPVRKRETAIANPTFNSTEDSFKFYWKNRLFLDSNDFIDDSEIDTIIPKLANIWTNNEQLFFDVLCSPIISISLIYKLVNSCLELSNAENLLIEIVRSLKTFTNDIYQVRGCYRYLIELLSTNIDDPQSLLRQLAAKNDDISIYMEALTRLVNMRSNFSVATNRKAFFSDKGDNWCGRLDLAKWSCYLLRHPKPQQAVELLEVISQNDDDNLNDDDIQSVLNNSNCKDAYQALLHLNDAITKSAFEADLTDDNKKSILEDANPLQRVRELYKDANKPNSPASERAQTGSINTSLPNPQKTNNATYKKKHKIWRFLANLFSPITYLLCSIFSPIIIGAISGVEAFFNTGSFLLGFIAAGVGMLISFPVYIIHETKNRIGWSSKSEDDNVAPKTKAYLKKQIYKHDRPLGKFIPRLLTWLFGRKKHVTRIPGELRFTGTSTEIERGYASLHDSITARNKLGLLNVKLLVSGKIERKLNKLNDAYKKVKSHTYTENSPLVNLADNIESTPESLESLKTTMQTLKGNDYWRQHNCQSLFNGIEKQRMKLEELIAVRSECDSLLTTPEMR